MRPRHFRAATSEIRGSRLVLHLAATRTYRERIAMSTRIGDHRTVPVLVRATGAGSSHFSYVCPNSTIAPVSRQLELDCEVGRRLCAQSDGGWIGLSRFATTNTANNLADPPRPIAPQETISRGPGQLLPRLPFGSAMQQAQRRHGKHGPGHGCGSDDMADRGLFAFQRGVEDHAAALAAAVVSAFRRSAIERS